MEALTLLPEKLSNDARKVGRTGERVLLSTCSCTPFDISKGASDVFGITCNFVLSPPPRTHRLPNPLVG